MKQIEYTKELQLKTYNQRRQIFNETSNKSENLEEALNKLDIRPYFNIEKTAPLFEEESEIINKNISIIRHDFLIGEEISQNPLDTTNLILNTQQISLDLNFAICKYKIKEEYIKEISDKNIMISELNIEDLNQMGFQSFKFIIKNLTKNLDLKNEILINNNNDSERRILIYQSVFDNIDSCLKIAQNMKDNQKEIYIVKKIDRYLYLFHDALNLKLIQSPSFGYLFENYYNFTHNYQKLDFIFLNSQIAKLLDCFTYWS